MDASDSKAQQRGPYPGRKAKGILKLKNYSAKKYAVHGTFIALMGAVALQGRAMGGVDQSSLLYTLVSGEEVIEGPLDPSAYAQADAPGVGGTRVAAA